MRLLGRLAELAACRGALAAGNGGAAAVVIAGAPGIGKTSVWRAAAESWPAGVVVLRTTGMAGGQAAFANLADLLDPVAGRVLPGLPGPQASALRAALGLAAAEGPLGETAAVRLRDTPVRWPAQRSEAWSLAIDDEQWVDADTGRLLQAAPVPALVVDDRLGTGALCDRAALYGVLAEIEALGLELLEVRRLPPA